MNFDDALRLQRGELLAAAGRWRATRRRRRRRLALGATLTIAALGLVLAATPAWALVRDALPFGDQPAASESVKVDFNGSLNVGAPAGMSPEAASDETREIMQATFGGKTHTLYVSPAKNGGYCELWTDASGGCNTAGEPLTWAGIFGLPHDASQPAETTIPKSEIRDPTVAFWLVGSVLSSQAARVVIRFRDGSIVEPKIAWVSSPIDAGFFAYDVPNDEQSVADHVIEVEAYNANGDLVERQQMPLSPTR